MEFDKIIEIIYIFIFISSFNSIFTALSIFSGTVWQSKRVMRRSQMHTSQDYHNYTVENVVKLKEREMYSPVYVFLGKKIHQ